MPTVYFAILSTITCCLGTNIMKKDNENSTQLSYQFNVIFFPKFTVWFPVGLNLWEVHSKYCVHL